MEWINEIIYWHWLIVAVVLIILEILIPGAYFLWMGVSAIFVGGLMYIFPELAFLVQILIFAILSVTAVMMYRSYRKKNPLVTDEPALNRRGEKYIGQSFTLKEPIVNGVGKIKVDDSTWKIKGFDIDAGETVRVVAAEGTTLIVEGSTVIVK
ncbi:MAG: NfeD family protein [Gammaproteobacteria bacterium]|nr:MAG: NfeD family protein [Gammaproteobacteria bacterium]RKZ66786.1 MAG: NfeD family protein [Gammaproteobacteria bacterium]